MAVKIFWAFVAGVIVLAAAGDAIAGNDSPVVIDMSERSEKLALVEQVEYLVARPLQVKTGCEQGDHCLAILPESFRQTQNPQPVIMRNYYLTAQAKQEVLPFWQGTQPLRLRNRFIK